MYHIVFDSPILYSATCDIIKSISIIRKRIKNGF